MYSEFLGKSRLAVTKRFIFHSRNLLLHLLLYHFEMGFFGGTDKRNGFTGPSCTARSPNPVDEVYGRTRQLIVDHKGKELNIDSPGQ